MTTVHEAQAIREAVVAALVAANTSAGARVYSSRKPPFKRADIPAIAVYTLSETSDDRQSAPREYKRKAKLAVEGAVQVGENVDDALDALRLEVETVMDPDPTFGDVCSDSRLTGTELELAEQGDQMVGLLRMTYEVTYYTDARLPPSGDMDDLKTVDAKTSLGGVQDEDDQAEDTVEGLDEPDEPAP